jgi:hypothetical protein
MDRALGFNKDGTSKVGVIFRNVRHSLFLVTERAAPTSDCTKQDGCCKMEVVARRGGPHAIGSLYDHEHPGYASYWPEVFALSKQDLKPIDFIQPHKHPWEEFEAEALEWEKRGELEKAKGARYEAQWMMERAKGKLMVQEEQALKEGRVVLTETYERSSTPDRMLWDQKGLLNFQVYTSQIGAHFMYWL